MLSQAGEDGNCVKQSSKREYSKIVEVLRQRLMESGGQIGSNRGQNDL